MVHDVVANRLARLRALPVVVASLLAVEAGDVTLVLLAISLLVL